MYRGRLGPRPGAQRCWFGTFEQQPHCVISCPRPRAVVLPLQVADPGLDLGRSKVVEAMHHLLATDGF